MDNGRGTLYIPPPCVLLRNHACKLVSSSYSQKYTGTNCNSDLPSLVEGSNWTSLALSVATRNFW